MSNFQQKYNLKSPAVKRLMREAAELREPTDQYLAHPLEDNLFEWHFTVRGPPDTEFSDGRYHGRIILPPEYPMKPPSIILLTPNGRFELGKKICLSMSAHHPETWQPSWSIRTVLLAIIGFMPTKGGGAIGALDYTPEERQILAAKSREWRCETCGMDNSACLLEADPEKESAELKEAKEIAAQINFKGEADKTKTEPALNQQEIQEPNLPQLSSDDMTQKHLNYYTQFYGMHNPAGGHEQLMQGPWQQPNNPANSDIINPRTLPNNTENVTSNTNEISEVSIRQRANVQQEEGRPPSPNEQVRNSPPERGQTIRNNQDRNDVPSRTDSVVLTLMWIIAAVLIMLILRRLAMESTTIAKT